jgi:hypothetical protein
MKITKCDPSKGFMIPDGYVVCSGQNYIVDENGSAFTSDLQAAHVFRSERDAYQVSDMWEKGGRQALVEGVQAR